MSDIVVAISTVADGNMLIHSDKANADVAHNREVFLAKHNIDMGQTTRVNIVYEGENYARYAELLDKQKGAGMRDDNVVIADALVTTQPGHALFLPLADCVGTVLYDPVHQVLMLSHLGRHSLEQQGGIRSVAHLSEQYHSHPKDIEVWLTPAPSKEVYSIWALDNKGMKEAVYEQLTLAGITPEHIHDNPAETDKDSRYYSYSEFLAGRRSEEGRHAIVAMMAE